MINEKLVGSRIVLKCNNNMSFAGTMKGTIGREDQQYIWVETDQESGFGILCPQDFVNEVFEIPIKPIP